MDDRLGRRHLAALVEAGMALGSELDLDALLQRIADLSREVIGAAYSAVGVVDARGRLVRFVHSGVDRRDGGKDRPPARGAGLAGARHRRGQIPAPARDK
jgi:two-component system sensor histidine kinase DevS